MRKKWHNPLKRAEQPGLPNHTIDGVSCTFDTQISSEKERETDEEFV